MSPIKHMSKTDYERLTILLAKRRTLIASRPRGDGFSLTEKLTYSAAIKALTKEIDTLMEGQEQPVDKYGTATPRTAPRKEIQRRSIDGNYCRECGGRMWVTPTGVTYHGTPGAISHADDADHTAIPEDEEEE